jgi:hypothetical protein
MSAGGKKGLTSLFDAVSEDISVGLAQLGLNTIQQINSNCIWPLSSHSGNSGQSDKTENWLISLPKKKEKA